jgi:tetraacyldisaccharide 4'-kinase
MKPFSAIFGAAVGLRNNLYDRRLLKVRRLRRPVVSIGNLSVGGTGKTPFVIMLGALLKARGIEVDVLSRGYGRDSFAISVVDPAGPPEQFGDEPLLIVRKLGAPAIVGADRYQAGLLAEEKFPQTRVHLLDDGFQHRRLHRDFDIVLVADEDLGESLLPSGRLREPFSSLRRADAIALTSSSSLPLPAKSIWRVRRQMHFLGLKKRLIAFCGIARPEQFFAGLKKLGMELPETIAFPDHHRYTQADVHRLLLAKNNSRAEGFISTEKDAINLGPLARQLQPFETTVLELELEDAGEKLAELVSALENRAAFVSARSD